MGAAGHMQPLPLTAVAVTQTTSFIQAQSGGKWKGKGGDPVSSVVQAGVGWLGGAWPTVEGNGGGRLHLRIQGALFAAKGLVVRSHSQLRSLPGCLAEQRETWSATTMSVVLRA